MYSLVKFPESTEHWKPPRIYFPYTLNWRQEKFSYCVFSAKITEITRWQSPWMWPSGQWNIIDQTCVKKYLSVIQKVQTSLLRHSKKLESILETQASPNDPRYFPTQIVENPQYQNPKIVLCSLLDKGGSKLLKVTVGRLLAIAWLSLVKIFKAIWKRCKAILRYFALCGYTHCANADSHEF